MKKLICIAVILTMLVTMMPLSVSVKASTPDWGADYDTATEFTISDKAELFAFRDMVNSGKSFSKITVILTADIDLNNEEWIPIGNNANPFNGSFQGNQRTVKNLKINDETLNEAGFFGNTGGGSGAVIADLTLENVDIRANHAVGALGGYMVTKTMNCNIIGDITISGTFMVGGLAGDHYSMITNSHVRANEGSSVNGLYVESDSEGDNIGGLIGLRGEGNNLISECSVANLKITGTRKIGGLIGAAFLSNSIENCSVHNVVIETNASVEYALLTKSSMGLGGLVGVFNSDTDTGHISASTVSDIEFIIPENIINNVTAGYMYGLSRVTGGKTPDLSDNLVTGSHTGSNNAKDSVAGIAVHYTRIEPTCLEAGRLEHWVSAMKYYADMALNKEITEADTIIPALGHNAVQIDAKDASCIEAGNIAYWYCETCDEYFADAALTIKLDKNDVLLEQLEHSKIEVEAKAPTCTESGHIAYWLCESCGKLFADIALTIEIALKDTIIEASGHTSLQLINVKEASCSEHGYSGDYLCERCNEIVRKGTVIAKTAHKFVNGECISCHEKDPDYVKPEEAIPPLKDDGNKNDGNSQAESEKHEESDSPMTGVEVPYSLYLLLSVCSGCGLLAWWKLKREKA